MNVELSCLDARDKFFAIARMINGNLDLNLGLLREFRLILIEAEENGAIEVVSDVLVHLEASRDLLAKIDFK